MRCYLVYDIATGRIAKYGMAAYDVNEDGGASMDQQADVGQAALPLQAYPTPATEYVANGALASRDACPISAALAGRSVTLSNCPIGTAYVVSGGGDDPLTGVTDAATMVFTFGYAGTFTIAIDCFPAQDYKQEFTVT